MSWLNTMTLLLMAYLAVFAETHFRGLRPWLDAQVDLLPPLMVYAALSSNRLTVALVAGLGGFWYDSLSANPLGISVPALLLVGFLLHRARDLILRDQRVAQCLLGLAASALAPGLTLVLLLTTGAEPLWGWRWLWQWSVMALGGALATPLCFSLFDWIQRTFHYAPQSAPGFREDRQIKHDRTRHVNY